MTQITLIQLFNTQKPLNHPEYRSLVKHFILAWKKENFLLFGREEFSPELTLVIE